MRDSPPYFIIVLAMVLLFLSGIRSGESSMRNKIQKEALSKGVAEFVATPEGKVEFRWKKPCK